MSNFPRRAILLVLLVPYLHVVGLWCGRDAGTNFHSRQKHGCKLQLRTGLRAQFCGMVPFAPHMLADRVGLKLAQSRMPLTSLTGRAGHALFAACCS